ncbi:hypothetical protein [Rhodothalassium salexigens]|uniref:hypothetical protein n=1 Tax=Rhodothalassium salexigens TaxID=1086 RepID=UPI0019147B8E|nr:hypothetical protein [Rhodothalassium salexigens]
MAQTMERAPRFRALARALALASVTVFLVGCGAPHLHTVREAKAELVGQDVDVLEQCIGEPLLADWTQGGGVRYAYSSAQMRDDGGLLLSEPVPDDDARARACVFTVHVDGDGRITAVRSKNHAGWGFGSIKACSRLVRDCVEDDDLY